MDNSLHNNWDKIGEKLSGYVPDEYSAAEWKKMDQMLNNALTPNTGISFSVYLKGLAGVVVFAAGMYFIFKNHIHLNQEETIAENITLNENKRDNNNTSLNTLENNLNKKKDDKANNQNKDNSTPLNTFNKSLDTEESIANTKKNNPLNKKKYTYGTAINNENLEINTNTKKKEKPEQFSTTIENSPSNLMDLFDNPKGDSKKTELNPSLLANKKENAENPLIHKNKTMPPQGGAISALPLLGFQPFNTSENKLDTKDLDTKINPIKKPKNKRIRMGAIVGVNSTITDYSSLATSTQLFFGLFTSKRISEKLELQLEAHFKYVNNYNVEQRFENLIYNSTGLHGRELVHRRYRQFYSLDIPIILKYSASNRLGYLGGMRFSYLGLDQAGRFFSSSENANVSVPLKSIVPRQGFWKYDAGLVLGAEYYLLPRVIVDLRYNQGFLDITPDNLYNEKKVHLNSDLQFSIRYLF